MNRLLLSIVITAAMTCQVSAQSCLPGDSVGLLLPAVQKVREAAAVISVGSASMTPLLEVDVFTPAEAGAIRVAAGDINGDRVSDIIVTNGSDGGSQIKVFDGTTGLPLADFMEGSSSSFSGGVFVATGDVDGDAIPDVITAAGATAGPRVRVFSGVSLVNPSTPPQPIAEFSPFPTSGFTGGVRVAAGDVNGDGRADIIVGTGPGSPPEVRVFDGATLGQIMSLPTFGNEYSGGVNIAVGDVNGDGTADVIVGMADVDTTTGGPHVRVFNGSTLLASDLPDVIFDIDGYEAGVNLQPSAGNVVVDRVPEPSDLFIATGDEGGTQVQRFGPTGELIDSIDLDVEPPGNLAGVAIIQTGILFCGSFETLN